jgi:hypothetical protein
MSISSVGRGPVSPIKTNTQVQTKQPQAQASSSSTTSSNSSSTTGAQPLNTSGRGQVVNLVV